MKSLILASCLILIPFQVLKAQNCLNLSGNYQTSESIVYQISQKNCSKMVVTDPSGQMEITFNLGPQVLSQTPIVIDGVEVGIKKALLESSLDLDEWFYQEKDLSLYHDGTKQIVEKKICVVQKERNRDLFTNCYDYQTQTSHQYIDRWL